MFIFFLQQIRTVKVPSRQEGLGIIGGLARRIKSDRQNVTSSSIVNACLEAARDINSPIILQVSQGGAAFFGGKGLKNSAEKQEASVAGAVAAAHFIRAIAPAYGV